MAITYATWNPLDKSTKIVLVNGNLTVVRADTVASWRTVRATQGKSSGKWYFEASVASSNQTIFGFGTSAMIIEDKFPGLDATDISWGYWWINGGRWNQGTLDAGVLPIVPVNTICRVKADLDAGSISIAVGAGAFQATLLNRTSVSGKVIFPAVGILNSFTPIFTANFGASPFTYAVPSGYNAGWFEAGAAGRRCRMIGAN